ncbi:tRNA wybutosine-synthesizing 3 family protein [Nanoarchaeota archaeon]
MIDNFKKRKSDILSKLDKSSKQSWDERIVSLCEKINSLEDYYTTSSCAGRVVIMIDQEKKESGLFLKQYHDLISFNQLKGDLTNINSTNLIKFKLEPPIIHIACEDLESASRLLEKAREVGWKKSGILSFTKNIILELNSTERLEFPILNNGKVLVDGEFLKLIVKKSNECLKRGWGKIERLGEDL